MVTVNPFLGSDGYMPFIEAAQENNKGVFLLLKTSNPSSYELKDLKLENGKLLYFNLAEEIEKLACEMIGVKNYSFIGAVLELLTQKKPVPGFGMQGGKAEDLNGIFLMLAEMERLSLLQGGSFTLTRTKKMIGKRY